MPNLPVIQQIKAIGVNVKVPKNFECQDAMEAACLALAMNHEKNNPTMKGLVNITKQAIIAERTKRQDVLDRLADLERKPKRIK